MSVRNATAEWKGTLKEGAGALSVGSGHFSAPYTWSDRFADGKGVNPEELIGAAHAGCYSMFLSALITNAGLTPARITTTAKVHLEAGPTITLIELETEAEVPGLEDAAFMEHAQAAKANCPVSKALSATEIRLTAKLVK